MVIMGRISAKITRKASQRKNMIPLKVLNGFLRKALYENILQNGLYNALTAISRLKCLLKVDTSI